MPKRPQIVRHPKAPEVWQESLRRFSMRTSFQLSLSRPMLEFLCATSEGVWWDRHLYYQGAITPENWIASSQSLIKRGLIERLPDNELAAQRDERQAAEFGSMATYRCTPAGKLIVELLKMAGIFVQADAAINKRARKA